MICNCEDCLKVSRNSTIRHCDVCHNDYDLVTPQFTRICDECAYKLTVQLQEARDLARYLLIYCWVTDSNYYVDLHNNYPWLKEEER